MSQIRIGTDEQFAAVHAALVEAGFTEEELCSRMGIPALIDFEAHADEGDSPETDAASVLMRLFVEGRYTTLRAAEEHLGTTVLQAMADLGLVETKPEDSSTLYSPVALYPTQGVYIVSDRWNGPDRSTFRVPMDVVYPAIVSNTQRFLHYLPRTPCDSFLDLCCGTGVAALHAARNFARTAYAFDIAERSTLFAEFNRRLNGIENVTVGTGDLYEPAAGKKFDRIVAHPPYVPTLRPAWIYFDGGEDGESIMRRIIAGAPDALNPGGLLYMLATGTDRKDAPLERRVRSWIGEHHEEFDVAVVPIRFLDTDDFAVRSAVKSKTPEDDVVNFKKLFERLGVQSMVYAAILVQRKTEDRPAFTVRRQRGRATGPEELLWLLRWESLLAGPDGIRSILAAKVRPNPDTELIVRHKLTEEGWDVSEHLLRTEYPFSMEARTDAWAPYLMGICDGSRTVAEHFEDLKAQGALHAEGRPEEFAQAIAVLVSGGFLLLDNE